MTIHILRQLPNQKVPRPLTDAHGTDQAETFILEAILDATGHPGVAFMGNLDTDTAVACHPGIGGITLYFAFTGYPVR